MARYLFVLLVLACTWAFVIADDGSSSSGLEEPIIEGTASDPDGEALLKKIMETTPGSAMIAPAAEFSDIFHSADGVDDMPADGSAALDLDFATNPFKSDKIATATQEEKQLKEEMEILEQLISRGDAIVEAMPAKKARLDELKTRFESAESTIATEKAAETLQEQQSLLSEVEGQMATLQKKIDELHATKTKLEEGISKTKSLQGGAAAAPAADAAAAPADAAAAPAAPPAAAPAGPPPAPGPRGGRGPPPPAGRR